MSVDAGRRRRGRREEGREGDRSIYADSPRRSSADPIMMRDETVDDPDKEERNGEQSSEIRTVAKYAENHRDRVGWGDQPNSDGDFSLRLDQYLISLI